METKVCTSCGGEKYRHSNGRWRCDPCNRARSTAYRKANIELVREKDRARVAAQTDEYKREKHKRWRDNNREHVREYSRINAVKAYWKNPDKFRLLSQRRYWSDPERFKAEKRAWANRNKEHVVNYSRNYREMNKSILAERGRRWKLKNANHIKEYKAAGRRQLSDEYVKKTLCVNTNLLYRHVPLALIELQRIQLQIKRLLKESKQ